MTFEQSIKFSADLLNHAIRTHLGYDINVAHENTPMRVEIKLSYFADHGERETSDIRKLMLFATNIRGRIDVLYKQTTLDEEIKETIPEFPNYNHHFRYLKGDLKDLLLNFFEANPINNEIEMHFSTFKVNPFGQLFYLTKEIEKLDNESRR